MPSPIFRVKSEKNVFIYHLLIFKFRGLWYNSYILQNKKKEKKICIGQHFSLMTYGIFLCVIYEACCGRASLFSHLNSEDPDLYAASSR